MLFGSRFVLAPGMDLVLPNVAGARAGAAATTCYISIGDAGQIYTAYGMLSPAQLQDWLKARSREDGRPSLLIRAAQRVPIDRVAAIRGMATKAGFVRVIVAAEESSPSGP